MYYSLSFLTGLIISVMITLNGLLTDQFGIYAATVIIHIAGFAVIAPIIIISGEKPFRGMQKPYLYVGGLIGVFITVFNNVAFGRISVSAIMALGLFSQSAAGFIIDWRGSLGMKKIPFDKRKISGMSVILCGIVAMLLIGQDGWLKLDGPKTAAVAASVAAGACVAVSRLYNAKLASLTSVKNSSFFNYLTGLALALPVFILLGKNETPLAEINLTFADGYVFLGGVIGVATIMLSNATVMKISAFYYTLLLFVGQVSAGMLIDLILAKKFSTGILAGGLLVASGMCLNLLFDRRPNLGRALKSK
ncbi:MAG: DMT family transporter [Defluviitaleaceae bacterium]|nr:DMT family transporter [Defluviitaleaceae bacterium]